MPSPAAPSRAVRREPRVDAAPRRAGRGRGRPSAGEAPTRDVIMQAATRVFAAKSFDAAPLREIADAAGVDVSLISYQFGSKLGLWQAIVDDFGAQLRSGLAQLRELCAGLDAATTLRQGLGLMIDYMCDHPEVPHIMVRNFHVESARAEHVRRALMQPALEWMLQPMQSLRAAGLLRQGYLEMLYIHFSYSLGFSIVRRPHLITAVPELADDAHFRASLRETLVDSMFAHA